MKKHLRTWLLSALASAGVLNAHATYLDDIGYTGLVTELNASGTTVPDGTGVKVTQSEAPVSTGVVSGTTTYAYAPNPALYTGVTITNLSSAGYPATNSWHADMVGQAIYGNSSMGSGVSNVDLYEADNWLQTGFLNYNSSALAPKVETSDVANFSWVGPAGLSAATEQQLLNRFDYSIQHDDYVAVVGINNNDSGTAVSQNLLASAYNVISVGRSDGVHVSGTSTNVNTGVTFPHVVVPTATTSEATAVVSGASVFLISAARSGTGVVHNTSANGDKSESIKALIMAGATKAQFPSWSNSSSHPLDTVYGAGQLNVENSYHILVAGEQSSTSTPTSMVASTGWDFNTISNLNTAHTISYYLNLTSGGSFSIALAWDAIYTGSNYNSLTLSLANLDLYLYHVNAGVLGSLVTSSTSTGDTIEYIWATGLAAGDYVIQVKNSAGGGNFNIDYGLAWQNNGLVPEPGTIGLVSIAFAALGVAAYRRRRVA